MRFTVTALGGARQNLGRVVDGIVRYLQPSLIQSGNAGDGGSLGGPSSYYADATEEPGRWLGQAAASAGLTGEVDPDDFASVLAGRDPRTGERLITAQGSAGRRGDLGVGNHTRVDEEGNQLYGEADAAAVLGRTQAEVSRLLSVGALVALSHLPGAAGATASSAPNGVIGAHLVPRVDPDGTRWIAGSELARCAASINEASSPEALAAEGEPDDQFPLAEAARLAGTTTRYLRSLSGRYEREREEIEDVLAAGRSPRRAYLVAHRGTRGQWLVTRQHLADFIQRREPPAVRVGFDVTLTTEKSLGVLALLSEPDVGASVLGAIQAGNDWALRWLEHHAAGRVVGERVEADGWTVASFRHLTSRALDPFPHHHNVVSNSVLLPDGTRRALDARDLYTHAQAASALATAEMRHQLSQQIGVRWRPARKGGWEVAGIGDDVLDEFSTRRNEIDDALRELEEKVGRGALPSEVDAVSVRTRPAKTHTPVADLHDQWRHRARRLGLGAKAIRECHGHAVSDALPDPPVIFTALAAGICANSSVFTRDDVITCLTNLAFPGPDGLPQPLVVGAAVVESLADDFLASSHALAIGSSDDGVWTTVEMLAVQRRIVGRYRQGRHQDHGLVSSSTLKAVLADHPHLTNEQRSLVEAWCCHGHQIDCAIGRAGAGKTTTVSAAVAAWRASGYRVLGASVKGEAARLLEAVADVPSETVAWYLAHDDPERPPFDASTVVVVDEASTLGDRQLDRLLTMAATCGAAVRLIGDPAQHGAVAAGGMFRVLTKQPGTPELVTSHRLADPHDQAAADDLRRGRIESALDHLAAAGHLHVADSELDVYRQMLTRWWAAHLAGKPHPMVDRRNRTREQLNRLAHLLRRAHGELGSVEVPATHGRTFAVGDRVTSRLPARDLHVPTEKASYIRNGAVGTIMDATRHPRRPSEDTLTIDFDGIGPIKVPRRFFDHHRTTTGANEAGIDHAYALTSYAVQGLTRQVSTSRVDPTASRAETYVGITRGVEANHLYITPATDPLDGEGLPALPAPSARDALEARLHRSRSELTAWELLERASAEDRAPASLSLQ